MSLLSIIIPVYNAAKHIPKFIKYLDHQLAPQIEWIFINDGSSDTSLTLLQEVALKYPYIKVLSKVNGGAASARNVGIEHASATYLAYVDIDDQFEIDLLWKALQFTLENQLDIYAYNYDYIASSGHVNAQALIHPIQYEVIQSGISVLQQGYQPSSVCVFLLKRLFMLENKLYFVAGITHEDVEVSLRYMLAAKKVYFSKEIIYHYYQHEGSVTNQITSEKQQSYLLDEIKIAKLMKANLERYNDETAKLVIVKNYNSVVWNLIYFLFQHKKTISKNFITQCIISLKSENLFPIKGALKTTFQKVSSPLFAIYFYLKY